MPRIQYPAILTKSDWDAKKGLVAKMYGKTGLGEACEAAERKYKLINWRIFEASTVNHLNRVDSNFVDQLMVVEFNRHILPASDYIQKVLKRACDEVADKFRRSSAIPASSRLHVENMSQTAERFGRQLKDTVQDERWLPTTMATRPGEQLTLVRVLCSPVLRDTFMAFCRREFSTENMDFILAVMNHQYYLPPPGPIALPEARAREIFNKFIPANAPTQVNLADDIREKLCKDVANNRLARIDWREPFDATFRLVRADTYRRFMSDDFSATARARFGG